MGTVFTFYWAGVAIFFNFVFYPHGDNHLIYEMETYHAFYMYTWYWFVISHVILYFPFSWIWFNLMIFDWTDTGIANYTFWVNTIIFAFGPPISVSMLFLLLLIII